jgi:hypothetical protein
MKLLNFDGNMETLHFPFEERQRETNEVWIVSYFWKEKREEGLNIQR